MYPCSRFIRLVFLYEIPVKFSLQQPEISIATVITRVYRNKNRSVHFSMGENVEKMTNLYYKPKYGKNIPL